MTRLAPDVPATERPTRPGRIQPWLQALQVDGAVAFTVATRAWQSVSGVVTLALIARYFDGVTQGFYYTFASLLALQSAFELGFSVVIVNTASHQWAQLTLDRDGRITGSEDALSRLVSLGRLVFRWYAAASLLFVVGVGIGGYLFFSDASAGGPTWQAPWLTLVILTGLTLWALPLNSLLEGCNQVQAVQRLRFGQVVLESCVTWPAIALGGGLWTPVASAFVKLLRDMYLLLVRFRRFFRPFFSPPSAATLDWKTDVWPMQWRLALSGIVNFLMYFMFNPVMFRYHGPVVAGQMGMTLTAVNAVQVVALAWVYTKVPAYGALIARRQYTELDRLWWRTSLVSVGVAMLGAIALWVLVAALGVAQPELAARFLPPLPTALLLVAMVLLQFTQCQSAYLRAHREEPLVALSVTTAIAAGLVVWYFGSRYGALGAAAGYAGVAVVSIVWETAIWSRCRALWHRPDPGAATAGA